MLSSKIPTAIRRAVYAREGHACALCERTGALHLHHILYRSAGGSNTQDNLIALCPVCHAIAHGEYALQYQFPFDQATALDAIYHYIEYS